MYICICNGITEEMLETACLQGASDKDVLNRLGIGNSCGICLIDAIDKIRTKNMHSSHDSQPNSATPPSRN